MLMSQPHSIMVSLRFLPISEKMKILLLKNLGKKSVNSNCYYFLIVSGKAPYTFTRVYQKFIFMGEN